MNGKYRGITYHINSTVIKTPQSLLKGKYRGQSYQLSQAQFQVKHSDMPMVYRGIKYNSNHNLNDCQPQFLVNSSCA